MAVSLAGPSGAQSSRMQVLSALCTGRRGIPLKSCRAAPWQVCGGEQLGHLTTPIHHRAQQFSSVGGHAKHQARWKHCMKCSPCSSASATAQQRAWSKSRPDHDLVAQGPHAAFLSGLLPSGTTMTTRVPLARGRVGT